MELARVFSAPDVRDRAFDSLCTLEQRGNRIAWRARVRRSDAPLQGREEPPVRPISRTAVARHDPARHDAVRSRHAACRRHGEPGPATEADVNIEFQSSSKLADQSMKLAFSFRDANEKYATDYPAAVGST